ncbi:MAG: RusA family crossover junction endodeoxyribonuclease [Novosphingobium sp.]|jgi:hypothetical protein|nr:RusA family crossover junction endodeoxyribonuclease [Novosphingobium sp.]
MIKASDVRVINTKDKGLNFEYNLFYQTHMKSIKNSFKIEVDIDLQSKGTYQKGKNKGKSFALNRFVKERPRVTKFGTFTQDRSGSKQIFRNIFTEYIKNKIKRIDENPTIMNTYVIQKYPDSWFLKDKKTFNKKGKEYIERFGKYIPRIVTPDKDNYEKFFMDEVQRDVKNEFEGIMDNDSIIYSGNCNKLYGDKNQIILEFIELDCPRKLK